MLFILLLVLLFLLVYSTGTYLQYYSSISAYFPVEMNSVLGD